jgi:hypothetical protein
MNIGDFYTEERKFLLSRVQKGPAFAGTDFSAGQLDEDVLRRDMDGGTIETIDEDKVYIRGNNNNTAYNFLYPGKSLQKKEAIEIGETVLSISEPYQIRKWGARKDQHSTGIDVIPSTDYMVALQEGRIIEVDNAPERAKVEAPVFNKSGSAGHSIKVQNIDGTITHYMHFDPISEETKKNLLNKVVHRGDNLHTWRTGSGSMTGPHVKVRVQGNHWKYTLDPSHQVRGGQYDWYPKLEGGKLVIYKRPEIATYRKGGILYGVKNNT